MKSTNKIEIDKKLLDIGGMSIEKVLEILKEMVRASTSNPLVGIAVSVASADMLNRAGLLSDAARDIIWVSIGAVEATQAAGNLLSDLIPFKNTSNDLLPSATTIVFGDSSSKTNSGLVESLKGGK